MNKEQMDNTSQILSIIIGTLSFCVCVLEFISYRSEKNT